jgi:hypothetical protein
VATGFAALLVAAATAIVAIPRLQAPTRWRDPDALFYQAQVLEVRGASQTAALRTVFEGPLANLRRTIERSYHRTHPHAPYHVLSRRWIDYTAPYFRRRWTVPALAAAIQPLAGTESLRLVSEIGYLLLAPLLFLLLRLRFRLALSFAVALIFSLLPLLRDRVVDPMTDIFSVALETACLLSAHLVRRHGYRWLPLWFLTIAALAFTRDAAVIPLAGLAWLTIRHKSRSAALMLATGIPLAALPALLFGASYRRTLAYTFSGSNPPSAAHATWGYLMRRFSPELLSMMKEQARYAVHDPLTAALLVTGLLVLYGARGQSSYLSLIRGSGIAAIALIYSVPQLDTSLRLVIPIVPIAAVGFAEAANRTIRTTHLQRALRFARGTTSP